MSIPVDDNLIYSIAVVWQRAADDWGSVWKEGLPARYIQEEEGHLNRVQKWLRENGVEFVSKKDGSIV